MIIRKGKLSDAQACHRLSNTPELLNPGGKIPAPEWFRAYVKNREILLVAEEGKELIGYVAGESLIEHGMILHLIAVKKEQRGKGVGQKLLHAFEKECKKRKVYWLILYAYDNKKQIKFFEKNRYVKGSHVVEFVKDYSAL